MPPPNTATASPRAPIVVALGITIHSIAATLGLALVPQTSPWLSA